MENVVLIIHLILAMLLIGAVLIQRSEGGALGMGGGGGNVMSGRSAATALQKATWGLAAAFLVTSLILTIFATQTARDEDVIDRLNEPAAATSEPAPENGVTPAEALLPPPPAPSGVAPSEDPLAPPPIPAPPAPSE